MIRFFGKFLIAFVSVVFLFVLFRVVPFYLIGWSENATTDWYLVYYPVLQSSDPYSVYGFFNPPWLVWILSPLSRLSQSDSHALWMAMVTLLTIKCIYSMGGSWLSVMLTISSPGFIWNLTGGQIDILVLLGVLMGSWMLITIKPQVLGMSILYHIAKGKLDRSMFAILPISLVTNGLWFIRILSGDGPEARVNLSLFPYLMPVGAIVFLISLRRKDVYLAGLSTYFFVPYISGNSLLVYSAIITSRYNKVLAILFSVSLWMYFLL